MQPVLFKKLVPGAVIPRYAHPGDAGMDLCSVEDCAIPPGGWRLVKTGLAVALPPGTEGQVRSRSGLALKHGISVLNSPGTVDAGYRGEIGVILMNNGPEPFSVGKGMRIAQFVVAEVLCVRTAEADALPDAERGADGFGSTGV